MPLPLPIFCYFPLTRLQLQALHGLPGGGVRGGGKGQYQSANSFLDRPYNAVVYIR